MIQIIRIEGATGFCPVEGCDDRHGSLLVYFDGIPDIHPSLDPEFLPSLKAKLSSNGFEPLDDLQINPEHLQGIDYISVAMGTPLAELWHSRME